MGRWRVREELEKGKHDLNTSYEKKSWRGDLAGKSTWCAKDLGSVPSTHTVVHKRLQLQGKVEVVYIRWHVIYTHTEKNTH